MRMTACLGVIILLGCGQAPKPPDGIRVELAWDVPADLDLLVDEQPAYTQGGTPDRQSAGEEHFLIPGGPGEYIVAVQNRSGHLSANPRVSIFGAVEDDGPILAFNDKPVTFEGTVKPSARKDCWIACSIDAKTRTIKRIDQWE